MTSVYPRISIVTPSFNQGQFLEKTILSVLDQGYPNLEYIIVDGGSTDASVKLIQKYSDRLAFWVSEKDRGQSHAINKGFEHATGDILAYLNSDDLYLNGALHRVAEAFSEEPGTDLFYGNCRLIDVGDYNVGQLEPSICSYSEIVDLWGVWWAGRNFVQPEVFWSRRIAERVGPFREDLNWVMDYDYWLRILKAGARVRKIDGELAAFRLHPSQKSTQPERTATELLGVLEPHLFAADSALSAIQRISLRGRWYFDARFRPQADALFETGEGRSRRWATLAAMVAKHPEMLCVPALYRRAYSAIRS